MLPWCIFNLHNFKNYCLSYLKPKPISRSGTIRTITKFEKNYVRGTKNNYSHDNIKYKIYHDILPHYIKAYSNNKLFQLNEHIII